MKVAYSILLCLLITAADLFSQERKAYIGVGLYGLVRGSIDIHSGYAFAEHWSLASDISFSYAWLKRVKSETESVHDSEFTEDDIGIAEPVDLTYEHISFRFWPQKAHAGPYISTGIIHRSGTGMDCTLGIGYAMPIWKSLHLIAGYDLVLSSMELSISYLF